MHLHLRSRLAAFVLACLAICAQRGFGAVTAIVRVPLAAGYNFVSNPVDALGNNVVDNSLTNVMAWSTPSEGTAIYLWSVASQSFGAPSVYSAGAGWTSNYTLAPGQGFVIATTNTWTLVLVGTPRQGSLTNVLAGGNKLSLVASQIPLTNSVSGMNLPAGDGETLYLFAPASQTYADAVTWLDGFGWFIPSAGSDTNGPTLGPAQSFFVQNPGPDRLWSETGPASNPASRGNPMCLEVSQ